MKLKFYVSRGLNANLAYTPLLYPFFGPALKQTMPFQSAALEKYGFDKNYYELTDNIEETDFVLLPHNYWYFNKRYPELVKKCVEEAQRNNKPLLIDAQGDSSENINLENTYVLRTSQYRSKFKENEIIVPAYAEDLLEAYFGGKLQIRGKGELPVAGFAGWADLPFLSKVRAVLKEMFLKAVFKKGIFFRKKAIETLKNSSLVKTNFIIRNFHSGHLATAKEDMNKLRREFVNNMLDSDYVLCTKGDGNYSVRFYEALSMGRIPLVVDTESVLPLEDVLNYKDFCVFVNFRNLSKIDRILSDFHKTLSDEKFKAMQIKARSVFENYLRIDRFTKYLTEKLKGLEYKL